MTPIQTPQSPVLLALRRIGPYHHARFQAAAERMPLVVLETRPDSQEYPWLFTAQGARYGRRRLEGAPSPEQDPPLISLDRQLKALNDAIAPSTIVCVGWADSSYLRLFRLAAERTLPLVVISDSRWRDRPRHWLPELSKRLLLRQCGSALVAGSESRAYLERLGFPAAAIHQPWDVVDNAVFQAPSTPGNPRDDNGTGGPADPPHFLCVCRFVAKKNHQGLLAAYAAYQRLGGLWGLRLIGAGPLEAEIRAAVASLPDPSRVQLDPFLQLEALRLAYSQAAAVVLASTSDQWGLVVNEAMAAGRPVIVSSACGCAVDLVRHGVTGWCFDPHEPGGLLVALQRLEQTPLDAREAMGAAARENLKNWDPAAFASGLAAAVEHASGDRRNSLSARVATALLSRR
ncbi:glycosyltransferase family 4 protein [Synechococcus sp. CS-1327]|uniref:glycosyltransferase family 4 protein n=1 Tax=Synechococcus sp. CS-1327 TaxID=2847977 RepID=UPI00223BA2E8|nr:glycosyltransferase family 4 protein [Synechococcus sp. CS-1327]MCT0232998.1 glycosyltransferase family 4 protein [Synechococcus sp. CS-1327]